MGELAIQGRSNERLWSREMRGSDEKVVGSGDEDDVTGRGSMKDEREGEGILPELVPSIDNWRWLPGASERGVWRPDSAWREGERRMTATGWCAAAVKGRVIEKGCKDCHGC